MTTFKKVTKLALLSTAIMFMASLFLGGALTLLTSRNPGPGGEGTDGSGL
jgi:hypothetical protein